MSKVGSGSIVTALTAAALAAVGVLAWQASAAPDRVGAARPSAGPSQGAARHSAPPSRSDARRKLLALPGSTGSGSRVVYSLSRRRVWLVKGAGKVVRTFDVMPGTLSPPPGAYAVTVRQPSITGTDGAPVQNIVYFATIDHLSIAFDSAVDGSLPTPDPAKHTGAIRERVADGVAMWQFAVKGSKVIVVP